MNPQYVQQQQHHPHYAPPSTNTSYGEPNANLPPKGPQDLHSYPPQKPPFEPPPSRTGPPFSNNVLPPANNGPLPPSNSQPPPSINGPPPLNNGPPPDSNGPPPPTNGPPPTSNGPPMTRPPYYVNDGQDPSAQLQNRPAFAQLNQQTKTLTDQMSYMNLQRPASQRPPSSQGYVSQPEKNMPTMPFSPAVNGTSNENHYPTQGDVTTSNLSTEKQLSEKSLPPQQGPPVSQSTNLQSYGPSGGTQLSGQQQHLGQAHTQGKFPGSNIPRSTQQSISPSPNDYQNQISNQNRMTLPVKPPMNANSQQSYDAPPLPGHLQGSHSNQPPLAGPPPLSAKQQNLSGPPLPGSYPSVLPTSNRQSLSGPALQTQNHPGALSTGLQSLRQPMTNQSSNLSGPPVGGQQNLSGSLGQQNVSTPSQLPGHLHSQYPYQTMGQQRFSPSPSLPTLNAANPYSHLNHQHSEPGYTQQYQQNYGQSNMYAHQASPYQSGVTSPTGGYGAQSQTRRLDPDQMPSPIQVIQDDQKTRGGLFTTNQKGLVPPLVTTKFVVEDQGNASPRFIRSSMYTVDTTADIIKQTQVPFSIILSPMAQVAEGEYEPPIVDMGELGPVRCNRCKAYMSPFMQFIDAGRRFQCMFCKAVTEVPTEYFQHLDHTGQRMDRYERPELVLGTYEFTTTKDYCKNNKLPKPPAIIFVIDVSYNTMKSGLINLLCAEMKKIIRNLPVDAGETKSNMKVGFITYNNTVQFYNIKANLAQPQMMIVGDVNEVFMPLLDGFLCDPEESEAMIDSLMCQIPNMFAETRETEIILGPAIQAGLEALKASECSGKLMVFHSSLPIADAPGKLKNRDERKLLGTDKEKTVIAPQTNFYNNLGQDCVEAGCSVDLFIFNNSYVDIATIGQVSRLTGGEVYKYTYFQADIDGKRLITDIINNISRPTAFDAVMRVRTSTGVRPTDFYGHFYMSNTTDIELASIDCDKAVAVEIKHDDKLTEDEGVYIQAALLYTSCSGVRRLRIINLSLKTSSKMADLYRSCDLDAIINYLFKQSVYKLVDSSSKAIKDNLISRCATILASYRKHCATPSSDGQLILPECMKLLPLYINGILKSDAISGGNGLTIDQKSYVMMLVATMPISESIVHVYPRLLPLHDVDPQDTDLPLMLRCSIDKFVDDGAYLLDNGVHMFLWLGLNLNPQWVQSVFGVASVVHVDTDKCNIPPLDNPLNERIRDIIGHVQDERCHSMKLTILRQKDKMEMVMRQFLVEDRGADGSSGYVDFLCQMHREIRTLLS